MKVNLNKVDSSVKEIFCYNDVKSSKLPFFLSNISAGFPSPADDYMDKKLDLNELLIQHPSSTFFVRVSGDSMRNAGIQDNDILIVDRSLDLENNKIIIATLDGELTVKRYVLKNGKQYLVPENPEYSEIEINEQNPFEVWGIVTNVIHKT